MTPRVLIDFAINTGKLYPQHLAMAREGATARVWELHVRVNVLPLYRVEHHEPYEGMSKDELAAVAKELDEYYANHDAEL